MRTLGALVAAGVTLAGVPLLELPAFYESFFYLVFFWTVLATSWNILSGYSGYFSFGHGAFFGTGMYTTATPPSTFYLLALAAAIVTLAVAYQVQYSPLGRGLFAIHDDEDVAEVLGVPTYRYKLAALAISCALAGVAGGIHALFVSYVTVGETFSIVVPLSVVLMSVLGGTRHWLGPAIGAALITALLYAFTASDYAVAGRAAVG